MNFKLINYKLRHASLSLVLEQGYVIKFICAGMLKRADVVWEGSSWIVWVPFSLFATNARAMSRRVVPGVKNNQSEVPRKRRGAMPRRRQKALRNQFSESKPVRAKQLLREAFPRVSEAPSDLSAASLHFRSSCNKKSSSYFLLMSTSFAWHLHFSKKHGRPGTTLRKKDDNFLASQLWLFEQVCDFLAFEVFQQ